LWARHDFQKKIGYNHIRGWRGSAKVDWEAKHPKNFDASPLNKGMPYA